MSAPNPRPRTLTAQVLAVLVAREGYDVEADQIATVLGIDVKKVRSTVAGLRQKQCYPIHLVGHSTYCYDPSRGIPELGAPRGRAVAAARAAAVAPQRETFPKLAAHKAAFPAAMAKVSNGNAPDPFSPVAGLAQTETFKPDDLLLVTGTEGGFVLLRDQQGRPWKAYLRPTAG